jgi:hypothetical protein
MELLQLVDVHIKEASRLLHEEMAMLKLLLARAGDSSEPTKACTSGGPELAPVQASFQHDSTEQKRKMVYMVISLLVAVLACHRNLCCCLPLQARAWLGSWLW